MEQILPVEDVSEEQLEEWDRRWDAGEDPDSAQEYLYRVMLEAEDIPDVVEAPEEACSDGEDSAAAVAAYLPKVEPIAGCSKALRPSEEWQRSVLADFDDLRQYLDFVKGKGVGSKESGSRMPVPTLKDELGWHIVCFGSSAAADVVSPSALDAQPPSLTTEPTTSTESKEENAVHGKGWANIYARGNKPSVRFLLQFDQVLVKKLLSYHVEWLQRAVLSKARAAWIYALLSRLAKPLGSGVASVVRDLLRRCCAQRAAFDGVESDSRLPCINLIICICARYFEQASYSECGLQRS